MDKFLKLERADSIEDRYFTIKNRVKGFIENLNNLDHDLKEEIVRKVIKKVLISDEYSLTFEYTFEE